MTRWEGKDGECVVLDAVTFLKVEGLLDCVEDWNGDWGDKRSCGDVGRWEQLRRDGQGTPYLLNKWMLGWLDGGTQMVARKSNDGRQMETKWQITGAN